MKWSQNYEYMYIFIELTINDNWTYLCIEAFKYNMKLYRARPPPRPPPQPTLNNTLL